MKNKKRFFTILFALICLLSGSCSRQLNSANAAPGKDPSFLRWLDQFYQEAAIHDISRNTFDKAFANVQAPIPAVLKKAAYQPEFTLTIWDYLDPRVNSRTEAKGRLMHQQYQKTLTAIETELGVEPHFLLAIWSMETAYGAVLKHKERFFKVPHALATLGYGDKKRARFGKSQLIAALQIIEAGNISANEMYGSWAGAMGHTQFIPTSYLAYGYDWNHDDKIDIWNSIPDALATAANLLKQNNWQTGKPWGYEVVVPPNGEIYFEQTKTLKEWEELGFTYSSPLAAPAPNDKAELKLPAGVKGPGFLAMKNFFVIKRYNNSDFYALAVSQLADRIAGKGSMVQSWPRPAGSLNFDQKLELQTHLKKLGLYEGAIDGAIGKSSKQAITKLQSRLHLSPNGKADTELLQKLRNKLN